MKLPWVKIAALAVFVEVFGLIAGTPSLIRAVWSEIVASSLTGTYRELSFAHEIEPPLDSQRIIGTGTAVALTNDGIALTNAHVVDGCSSLTVTLGSKSTYASVLKSSETYDLALLQVDLRNPQKSLRFRLGSPSLGEEVTVFGYPLSSLLSRAGNLTTGNVSALDGGFGRSHLMQLSAPVQAGNSGSGVFNKKNELVGIVESKLDSILTAKATGDLPQNINFAVTTDVIASFFSEYTDYPKGFKLELLKSDSERVRELQESTYLVRCFRNKGERQK